jgi:hypothetical protein
MNMNDKYRICISSPPDRKKLVAEIFFGTMQWAEINQEDNNLQIEFYPRSNGEPWQIDFESVISALTEAKRKLTNR